MRCRTRSPSPCASGRATACRPTRAPGSRRPPVTAPSTACAASRVDGNCSARSRCFRPATTIPARPRRRDSCRTTGFASSSPAATWLSPRDRALIEEGQAIVRRCLRRNQPGAYQLKAAINAVHADAATVEQTDWSQIVALYDQLLAVAPTPVVALNRAIAIGEVQDPATALALVDDLDLDNYHPFHATRADLLRRLGRNSEAAAAYQRAAAMAPTDAERDFLRLGGRASR